MQFSKLLAVAAVVLLGPAVGWCLADVSLGLTVGEEGLKSFYLAIGEHYQAPEKDIVVLREKKIPDEEMPVVFFLARHAEVDPAVIVTLRLGGKSWMDICLHFGLSVDIFYVPVKSDPGPPYGKAYGHYKKRKQDKWGEIRFSDIDIVNLVNLKFICERYGYSPDEVIKLRGSGSSFVDINFKIKAQKQKETAKAKQLSTSEGPQKQAPGKKDKGKEPK
ncbi:MAG: hypothetical protein AB1744_09825 [Candidatus Zixiibacteriota bacterium]